MKLPRFLRTKNGVFRTYLVAVVLAYSALFAYVFGNLRSRVLVAESRALESADYCARVASLCGDIREQVAAWSGEAAERGGSVGGSKMEGAASGTDSGAPEPEPMAAPIAEPRPEVLGVGQNGIYAYADIRYPDGQVYRKYTRLPAHLRRKGE